MPSICLSSFAFQQISVSCLPAISWANRSDGSLVRAPIFLDRRSLWRCGGTLTFYKVSGDVVASTNGVSSVCLEIVWLEFNFQAVISFLIVDEHTLQILSLDNLIFP
jgi:hypothetical protein